jgi:hypothetical protein
LTLLLVLASSWFTGKTTHSTRYHV